MCPGCAGDIKAINAFKKAQREEAEVRKGGEKDGDDDDDDDDNDDDDDDNDDDAESVSGSN